MNDKHDSIDRRIIKSKQALKDALIQLMKRKEFKEISITDLVQVANLNRGTFYKHFQYKEDILDEILDDVIQDLIESYRDPYLHVEVLEVRNMTSAAVKVFDHVYKFADFYVLIVKSDKLSGFQNRICNVLKNLALESIAEQRPHAKINPDIHASYIAYSIFGIIIEWINGGLSFSPEYMSEQLLEIVSLR
ncbi:MULTISPECIES: TetR/AcrR family transcriptional regulator [unclassified Paenibacillus]|uniref:TetR/AcrR family transcriptional regulator n=1 Tax=Paenibacillus provencensis TaxID=441151 RepID=A0ABW3PRV9_9BACL|nr:MULTISPECIES: TetR/AcrR family transcriptional regulator [unclassified Paenibacillus]MCM3126962.1 TetR/AcrR family transcriptional regulator [Paenibacillus sp. MER 78]SFS57118.1 DNA-binding transcriptional regulator, AcrR family [Paenibacillus sp. 453mf]